MDDVNVITADGLAELERQLEELEGSGRREIAERIKTAREWGDLKENSEYHDAKNDQAHLETKIARLRERITRASVVETGATDGAVSFGSTVVVRDEKRRRADAGSSSARTRRHPRRAACRSTPPSRGHSSAAAPATRCRSRCRAASAPTPWSASAEYADLETAHPLISRDRAKARPRVSR